MIPSALPLFIGQSPDVGPMGDASPTPAFVCFDKRGHDPFTSRWTASVFTGDL